MIRQAVVGDIPRLNELLYQVQQVHAQGRPDIFKAGSKKYTTEELEAIIGNEDTPIYVYDDGTIKGYAFCILQETEESKQLFHRKTCYIDDLCVDREARGQHIGTRLYEYVYQKAAEFGCDSVTLNVWALNGPAMKFYQSLGLLPLKTTMESQIKRDV